MFGGFFPTKTWITKPRADPENPADRDIYVLFSYSEGPLSVTPHDTLAVEMTAWLRTLADIKKEYPTLPSLVGDLKPLL